MEGDRDSQSQGSGKNMASSSHQNGADGPSLGEEELEKGKWAPGGQTRASAMPWGVRLSSHVQGRHTPPQVSKEKGRGHWGTSHMTHGHLHASSCPDL